MGVFTYVQVSKQCALLEVLNFGIGIETDMYFVAHSIHIYIYDGRAFKNKIAFQKGYHGCEYKGNYCLKFQV